MTGRPDSKELAAVPADAVLHIYWCPHCERQIERLWHTVRRGPALIPQLDEEHYGIRVRVYPAARLQAAEQALREIADSGVPGREFRSPLAFVIHLQGIARRALEGAAG